MSWNVEWLYDEYSGDNFSKLAKEKASPSRSAWNWRRDAFAAAIAKVSPTVVALQEVESRRVLWYMTRALDREHRQSYQELGIESGDHYTEQDVGFLYRPPADALSIEQRMQTRAMRASENYFNLTKHLFATFQIPVGDHEETVTVLNLHLRAREQAEPLRRRQARLAHRWIADAVARGENVIVLGDFNTEEEENRTRDGSDVGILSGRETPNTADDLVDLTLKIPRGEDRVTHLLGKRFDRILVSASLLEDTPGKQDLVFESIEVRADLAIRGGQDEKLRHWEHYWEIPETERDLSDHYPVIATFAVR
jgi:endonuclease/exonuclease/phosphatase family metal-dependent hydrolase